MFQDPSYISMIGLGALDVPNLLKGIHLRWQFPLNSGFGFPEFGFDLYRRKHFEIDYTSIPVDPLLLLADKTSPYETESGYCKVSSTVKILYNNSYGYMGYVAEEPGMITITYKVPVRGFRINEIHKNGKVMIKAYFKSEDYKFLVDQTEQSITNSLVEKIIEGDHINHIEISFENDICIHEIQQAINYDGESEDYTSWTLLGNFKLPTSWDEAALRLPEALRAKHKPRYPELAEIISRISEELVTYEEDPPTQDPPANIQFYPVSHLLLLSFNTVIARILGLYFIDETAVEGEYYDYMIVGVWSSNDATTKETHKWITYNLTLDNPAALNPPDGLMVTAKKLYSKEKIPSQTGCALRWNIPVVEEIIATASTAVMYHVYRQNDSKIDKLTKDKPLIIGHSSPSKSFYIDGPLPDGLYVYQISNMDLFGRESDLSDGAEINLVDLVPPPPPINIKGRLDNSTLDAAVSWIWDESRREIAPDANKFRIYYQTENLIPIESYITKVSSSMGGSVIETELDAGFDYSAYSNGYVLQNGRKFRITSISVIASKVIFNVSNAKITTVSHGEDKLTNVYAELRPIAYDTALSTMRPYLKFTESAYKARGRFLLQRNWDDKASWMYSGKSVDVDDGTTNYKTEIKSLPIIVSKSIPVAYAYIGVSTIDKSGNEGAISVPIKVAAYWSTKPEAPELPAAVEYATRADYYGKSYYTLKLDSIDSEYYFEVMRTTDAAIAFIENKSSANADQISDDDLVLLGKESDKESAFVCVGRIQGADVNEFTDSFPGKVRNRYLYRIRTVDKAGNRSALSANLVLVKLHDVTPPKAPVLSKVLGGERQIKIQWSQNGEKDVAGYRVYRSETPESAEDIRSMNLITILDKEEISYTDSVVSLTDYWYRITSFDSSGNESESSISVLGRAYEKL